MPAGLGLDRIADSNVAPEYKEVSVPVGALTVTGGTVLGLVKVMPGMGWIRLVPRICPGVLVLTAKSWPG